jgi:hypothetical protein
MSNLQSRLLDAADDFEKLAANLRGIAHELEPAATGPTATATVPPAQAAATEPPASRPSLASWELVTELHKLIKGHTNNKAWTATLRGCNVAAPQGFAEPKNADELRNVCNWLAAADAEAMIGRIKSAIK